MQGVVPGVWWAAKWWWGCGCLIIVLVEGGSSCGTAACSRLDGIWAAPLSEVMAAVADPSCGCGGLGESAGDVMYSYSPGVCGWPLGGGL